ALDVPAADVDAVVGDPDLLVEPAGDGVVLQQVGDRRRVTEVVVGDQFEVVAAGDQGPEIVAPDPTETIDANPSGHAALLDPVRRNPAPEASNPSLPVVLPLRPPRDRPVVLP